MISIGRFTHYIAVYSFLVFLVSLSMTNVAFLTPTSTMAFELAKLVPITKVRFYFFRYYGHILLTLLQKLSGNVIRVLGQVRAVILQA